MTGPTDTGGRSSALDQLARLFAVIDAASEYGFSLDAAANAAAGRLADMDQGEVMTTAAMLAALIATDLRPLDSADDISRWSGRYSFALARQERPT